MRLTIDPIGTESEVSGAYVFRDEAPVRFRSQLENGAFGFGRIPPARFTFRPRPDGRLAGERIWRGGVNQVVLRRQP